MGFLPVFDRYEAMQLVFLMTVVCDNALRLSLASRIFECFLLAMHIFPLLVGLDF